MWVALSWNFAYGIFQPTKLSYRKKMTWNKLMGKLTTSLLSCRSTPNCFLCSGLERGLSLPFPFILGNVVFFYLNGMSNLDDGESQTGWLFSPREL